MFFARDVNAKPRALFMDADKSMSQRKSQTLRIQKLLQNWQRTMAAGAGDDSVSGIEYGQRGGVWGKMPKEVPCGGCSARRVIAADAVESCSGRPGRGCALSDIS